MGRDSSTNDMARIQEGLEAFLQQEMRNMQKEKAGGPQLYDIRKSPEEDEKELEIIDFGNVSESNMKNYDYQEDWDSKEHLARVKARKKQEKQSEKSSPKKSKKTAKTVEKPVEKKASGKKKNKKKKSKFKRFFFTMLLLLALLLAGMYYIVGTVYNKLEYEEIDSVVTAPMQEEGVVNILLIGNDSRSNGEDGRSDAMILLTVSNKTKKIYMTSLLRDMYVDIPGHDGNRLNAAYAFGGAELLMETIEQNFDITVNRYMLVNFEAFANLVDAVGGVDLELSAQEVEYVNAYLWEYNVLTERPEGTDYMDSTAGGMVHLNGAQALAYTRNRYLGTDFGRTERQRKVLEEVIRKAPKALATNPKELIDGLVTNLRTNLTQQECFELCFRAAGAINYDIEQASIPMEGTYSNATIRGMSVLEVDFEANKEFIQKNIYGEEE